MTANVMMSYKTKDKISFIGQDVDTIASSLKDIYLTAAEDISRWQYKRMQCFTGNDLKPHGNGHELGDKMR